LARKIIIDTDPGQDDAVAIRLALASPEDFDVLGVVAVAGNVGLAQNARNALKVVELSGRTDVPVYTDRPRNVLHLRSAGDEGVYRLLTERLARLP
jgi:inosine-uridine nucleoside N-ribohydrolase